MTPYIRLCSEGAISPETPAVVGREDWPTGVFGVDDAAPIIRRQPDGAFEVRVARWGMPSPGRAVRARAIHRAYRERRKLTHDEFEQMAADEPDSGAPFIDASAFVWRSVLEPAGRCVVPFSAVGAHDEDAPQVWTGDYLRPPVSTVGFLGGVWEGGWQGVRRAERGRETLDLFGLVAVERIVQSDLRKRAFTPIVLNDAAEVETWLSAPWSKAKALRRKPDGALA